MENYLNYARTVIPNAEESLSKIVEKVSPNSIVLDIGCSTGMLGRYLALEKGCIIDGVDIDEKALENCSPIYRKTVITNLEIDDFTDYFTQESYDFIVVADVIEHLNDPIKLLLQLKLLIKPYGEIIFSIPNITHIAAALELLLGNFNYRQQGLLDSTHLRFYSYENLVTKLANSGLYTWEVDTVSKDLGETEFGIEQTKIFPKEWLEALIESRPDALVYQWIVTTKIYPQLNPIERHVATRKITASTIFTTELFWEPSAGAGFDESHKILGNKTNEINGELTVDFKFKLTPDEKVYKIRIDPISEKKLVWIKSVKILSNQNVTLWEWSGKDESSNLNDAKWIEARINNGAILSAESNDPQWYPSIPIETLNAIDSGARCTIVLCDTNSIVSSILTDTLSTQTIAAKQFIAEHDSQIAERDSQIAERDSQIAERDQTISAIHLSRSWTMTKPLRELSRQWQRLVRLYQNYRQIHPGISGFRRLGSLCINAIQRGGIKELRHSVAMHEWSQPTGLRLPLNFPLMLSDAIDRTVKLPEDIAVHTHIYYSDLAKEVRSYLENIPVKFHLYVTTDTSDKAKIIENIFADMGNVSELTILVTENRGRDIFPMLVSVGANLAQHDIVLHIHTKRSPHNSWILGGWRRYMMESLLGNPQRVTEILQQFVKNEKLGILFPDPYSPIKPFITVPSNANDANIKKLLSLAGKDKSVLNGIDRTFFPAGDMFWFRGSAIKPFIEMKLSAQDFEPEEGQVDATLAHAVERLFPYFASVEGLITKSYHSNSFLSPQCSAHEFNLFNNYIEKNLIKNTVILFDHNLGGGTNTYTRELVKNFLSDSMAVLRVYNSEGIWFVKWIANGDGMLFYTNSIEALFKGLLLTNGTRLIVNSLYGCPNIQEVIYKIIELIQKQKIPLDMKIHDFFSLCPSPHLSDLKGDYCGVPKDFSVCSHCLKNNLSWYVSWYPKQNQPVEIMNWRQAFVSLIEAATTVTFFDRSSIDIFRRAFYLEESKIQVIPHKIEHFECGNNMDLSGSAHIGILGTLTNIKGGGVVLALSNYINDHGLKARITVVGQSLVSTPSHINVHGAYEPNHLPIIIRKNKINVIFVSSIVPETFSYTISEAMAMGLPIVAFDLGAQGNRVKQYPLGKVVPLGSSPEMILMAIQSVLKIAQGLRK
jgi:2-polyprenyl-3-methyl-5-hydroxy-6-metoxy-1,4-benzoquinol methylase/glycosyltransferase involved in cell wall biosynthesis